MSFHNIFKLFILFIIYIQYVDSNVYDKCSMARELLRYGFFPSDLANWVCLVESGSGYQTMALNKYNVNGSWDWGLFQINDMYWCKPKNRKKYKPKANMCNIKCEELLSDDLTVAAACAKLIKEQNGFDEWHTWRTHCKEIYYDLSECDLSLDKKKEKETCDAGCSQWS